MELIHGVAGYKDNNNKLALALGNFDGMHLAHQKIIERVKYKAEEKGLKSAVFILDPHPFKILFPYKKLGLLSSLPEKAEALENLGIDYMFVEKFTREISLYSPFKFVQNYLVDSLKVKEIVVGYDYTFGRQGKGTTHDLCKWGKQFGFNVNIVPPVTLDQKVVSSSLIRDLISRGKVQRAADFLGTFFKRKGEVVHGDGRGRLLGYPTANLDIDGELLLPKNGVYLSLASRENKKIFGLANVGNKPTFGPSEEIFVEIHLMDFYGNVYAEELTTEFLCRIRDEMTFKNATYLKKQIEADIKIARELIAGKYAGLLEGNLLKERS